MNVTEVRVNIVIEVRQTSPRFANPRMKAHMCFWYPLEPV